MKKILTIVGARPQFIKLAPLSKKIRQSFNEVIVHTGQHYDFNMSKLFFDEMNIPKPDFNLDINQGNHGEQTGRMLIGIEKLVLKENPEIMIVFGDTNSTLAGALVASKLGIPLVHVEAGLRSFNKKMPEEQNRIVTDHIADYLFAPTNTGFENLEKENLSDKAYLTGDIMLDSVNIFSKLADTKSKVLDRLGMGNDEYYLLTLHRPYNVDNRDILVRIFSFLAYQNEQIVLPIHPRTKGKIKKYKIEIPKNIKIVDPQGYLDMLMLQKNSSAVITDSGGIQKEAFILKKKCFTLRPETEWVETTYNNWNMLINPATIKKFHLSDFLSNVTDQQKYFGSNVTEKMINIISGI